MTTIEIKKDNERITKVCASGHTDAGVAGEDIVCAGISSIMQTAILGVQNIYKIDLMKERDEDGYLELVVPNDIDAKKDSEIQIILQTMLCGLKDLADGYPNNIIIKEI